MVNSFLPYLRLTVKIFQFLRLSTKFLAILLLSVNPIETLINKRCFFHGFSRDLFLLRIQTEELTWCRTSFNCFRIVTLSKQMFSNCNRLYQQSLAQKDWGSRSLLLFRVLHNWDHFVKQTPDAARPREEVDSTVDSWAQELHQHESLLTCRYWLAFWCWCFFHWLNADRRERWSPSSQFRATMALRSFASLHLAFKCAIAKSSCSNALVWAP